MYVGVIEWASASLACPTVIVAHTLEDVLRETGKACRGFDFDDGGEIDQHRDAFREDMTGEELRDWYDQLWEQTTDCALSVYEAARLATVGRIGPVVVDESTTVGWRA